MFAIIRTDGKQYRVTQGGTIRLARISANPGDSYETDQVLAIGRGESELEYGKPVIVGAKVQGTILKHGKDQKVIVFKRKRRKTYRRKYGHRQAHTLVKIEKISAKSFTVKKGVPEKKSIEKVTANKALDKKSIPVKNPAAKTAAKKAAPAKVSTVKTTAKKASPVKTAAKKAAPAKVSTVKTVAKKSSPEKTTAKKASPVRTTAKKAAEK